MNEKMELEAPVLSDAGALRFAENLYRLLERQVGLYAGEPNGTLSMDTVERLLTSLCLVLDIDRTRPEEVAENMAGTNLTLEFERRIDELQSALGKTERLWNAICQTMPPLHNIALRDTLASIEGVWKRYEARFFAQDLPCEIDYPLCHPVSENKPAALLLNAYLRNLLTESRFIARFDTDDCARVLEHSCPDWQGLVVNLYEPIAAASIGRMLVGMKLDGLEVDDTIRSRIRERLHGLNAKEMQDDLVDVAIEVGHFLRLDLAEQGYLMDLAKDLQPRLSAGGYAGVFVGPH